MPTPKINLQDFTYHLPEEKIAQYPLAQRDHSKLLHYHKGTINTQQFHELPQLLKPETLLVFNNTKVIPARLYFRKDTGALIEVLLLEPALPTPIVALAMQVTKTCVWKCMIGNQKKWREGETLTTAIFLPELNANINLNASWHSRENNEVQLSWDAENITFLSILNAAGEMPIPPYLNREANEDDASQYQTVYAKHHGAVAAPTAGLHFTDTVLQQLQNKQISQTEVTLHVSAGTFQPIKETADVQQHNMHAEQIIVYKKTIELLLNSIGKTVVVGTTSMRTLESLYWYGVKLMLLPHSPFFIEKLFCYETILQNISVEESLNSVLRFMQKNNLPFIQGSTEIIILPGYIFKICNGLITNFHQPDSTLILLIAAFIGEDWRTVYQYALDNDYRFLSYGDSSLLMA